jgi:LPXTG-motif cell wall-anchored protein
VFAPAAHAVTDPFPAGSPAFTISGSFAFTVPNSSPPPATLQTPVNFSATLSKGTSDGSGNITFPKANITFPTITGAKVAGVDAVITVVPTTNWTSTINTATGAMSLKGSLTAHIDLSATLGAGVKDCPLGPISADLESSTSGGKKFAAGKTTDTATVVDRTFAVPASTGGTCAIQALINGNVVGLDLPIAKGDTTAAHARYIIANLTIFPPGVTVTTTTTTTTTTVAPVTTTTVGPTALPRTGSSSLPLTIFGSALVAGGLAVVLSGRRRFSRSELR